MISSLVPSTVQLRIYRVWNILERGTCARVTGPSKLVHIVKVKQSLILFSEELVTVLITVYSLPLLEEVQEALLHHCPHRVYRVYEKSTSTSCSSKSCSSNLVSSNLVGSEKSISGG